MGKGGGGGNRGLEDIERELIGQQRFEAQRSGDQQQRLFDELLRGSQQSQVGVPGLVDTANRNADFLQLLGTFERDEGIRRRALEEGIAGGLLPSANQIGNLGLDFRRASGAGAQNIAGLGGQFTGGLGQAGGLANQFQVGAEGARISQLASENDAQLRPIRDQSLGVLNDALQGNISPQIQQLFTNATGGERDILEQQFNVARDRLQESGQRGGALNSNLASLEGQRALALGRLENQNTNAQRALAGQLFGTAVDQGLGAPGQTAALSSQAGSLLGQSGQLGLGAENIRQSALAQQLGALDTALGRDLSGIAGQQASEAQRIQLAQALAAQLGQGGDQLRLTAPGFLNQATALRQQALEAPGIPGNILGGAQITPASSFLGPAQSSVSSSLAQAQQASAQRAAGQSQLLGSGIGAAAGLIGLAAFT